MVRIGIVGVGFMGMIHYLAARKLRDAQVTALCSRDAAEAVGGLARHSGQFRPARRDDGPGRRQKISPPR